MNQYLLDLKLKQNNLLFILSVFYVRDLILNSLKECSDGNEFIQKVDGIQKQINRMKDNRKQIKNNEFNYIMNRIVDRYQIQTIIQNQQSRQTDNQLLKYFQQLIVESMKNDRLRLDMVDLIRYMIIERVEGVGDRQQMVD